MTPQRLAGARWALLAGNFAIGSGVLAVPGSLNDLTRSLQVSVPVGGQLITLAAIVMCVGAPAAAAAISGVDRRRLLTLALAWFAAGHALSALAPSYATLLPLRALSVLGAAVFTPQAAAAIGAMAPPDQRGRAMTFVFLGWSLASVLGMPLHSYIGQVLGWRYAFGLAALLSAIGALWVWRALPDGIRLPAMSLAAWRELLTHPVLMAVVLVTGLTSAGQFSLFSYFAPYLADVLSADARALSFLFFWFGAFGLTGNVLLSRRIDSVGPDRAVALLLLLIASSLVAWPFAHSVGLMAVVLVPWGLGCFASNSAQQVRLGLAAPALAPALMALNTSAIYLGQAVGAASGGALVAADGGFGRLHLLALGFVLASLALSLWAGRRLAVTHA